MASRSIATTQATKYLVKLKEKFPGPFEKAFIGILRFSLVVKNIQIALVTLKKMLFIVVNGLSFA